MPKYDPTKESKKSKRRRRRAARHVDASHDYSNQAYQNRDGEFMSNEEQLEREGTAVIKSMQPKGGLLKRIADKRKKNQAGKQYKRKTKVR